MDLALQDMVLNDIASPKRPATPHRVVAAAKVACAAACYADGLIEVRFIDDGSFVSSFDSVFLVGGDRTTLHPLATLLAAANWEGGTKAVWSVTAHPLGTSFGVEGTYNTPTLCGSQPRGASCTVKRTIRYLQSWMPQQELRAVF